MLNKYILILLFGALILTGCDKDDPVVPNEEELITTLRLTLVPVNGDEDIVLVFEDLDGDGPGLPTNTGGTLAANSAYAGSIQLLNNTESPAEDITLEVEEEDEDHQFFYESSLADLNVDYDDADADGNPIGISTTLTTGGPGAGTLTITLLHEPDKFADGVLNGDQSNAGGESDISVTFSIDVL